MSLKILSQILRIDLVAASVVFAKIMLEVFQFLFAMFLGLLIVFLVAFNIGYYLHVFGYMFFTSTQYTPYIEESFGLGFLILLCIFAWFAVFAIWWTDNSESVKQSYQQEVSKRTKSPICGAISQVSSNGGELEMK